MPELGDAETTGKGCRLENHRAGVSRGGGLGDPDWQKGADEREYLCQLECVLRHLEKGRVETCYVEN
jgi:hypothetical protein